MHSESELDQRVKYEEQTTLPWLNTKTKTNIGLIT